MNSRPLPYQGSALPLSYTGVVLSGRRGSNPRPSAWKADALPTELLPLFQSKSPIRLFRAFSGRRWIRTTEGINQQIYSLPHLATLVFSHCFVYFWRPLYRTGSVRLEISQKQTSKTFGFLSRWRESNPRPRDYKSRALAN